MAMDQQYTNALKELEAVKVERDECRNHLAAIAEMTGNGDDIGAAHEGVNALAEDLARHKRMFTAACETLGEIQQALGNDIVGIEPVLVKELIEERDALAAKVELATEALEHRPSLQASHMAKLIKHLREANTTTLARREARIKAASLERFIKIYLSPGLAHNRATGELDALRKQAEGHQ